MGRKPKHLHYPSFFKVLMDGFATKLLIPRAFVMRNLDGKLPAKVLIKTRNDSHLWNVEVKKTGEAEEKYRYSFMQSGWRKFVRDCGVKEKDFLVFTLMPNLVFEVVRYAPNGCEEELQQQDSVSEQMKENPTKAHYWVRKSKEALPPNSIIELHHSDSDQINQVRARKTRSPKSKEALPHPSSKRSSGGVADHEATSSREQTEHPHFTKVFQKCYGSYVTVPMGFVKDTGMASEEFVNLRNEEGKVWEVEICERSYPGRSSRFDLRDGWPDFWKQNKIRDGDSCLFKFITGAGNLIDVVVQRKGSWRDPSSKRSSGGVAEASSSREQTEPPHFKKVFNKYCRSYVMVPMGFVKDTGMASEEFVNLRNEEGKVWEVEICERSNPGRSSRFDLRDGWPDFWKQNKIRDGDLCLFKFITSAGNLIDVVV